MNALQIIREAYGFLDLGDPAEAAALLDRLTPEDAQTTEARMARFRLAVEREDCGQAAELGKELIAAGATLSELDVCHWLNQAGRPREAYDRLVALESSHGDSAHYWFNRACFASRCVLFAEALQCLGMCFSEDSEMMAYAFFDPDLAPLWEFLEDYQPDAVKAELFVLPVWHWAIDRWKSQQDTVKVPVNAWNNLPGQLREFVPPRGKQGGLVVPSEAPPELHQEFDRWKWTYSEPRVEVLQNLLRRSHQPVLLCQGEYAYIQAKAGNFTAARFHYLLHLATLPHLMLPDTLIRGNFLAVLQADVAEAMAEDPQFCLKLESARVNMNGNNVEATSDSLEAIGPAGRQTKLYRLRLAQLEHYRGRSEESLRLHTELLEVWPFDFSLAWYVATNAMQNGQWDRAREVLRNGGEQFRDFNEFETLMRAVEERTRPGPTGGLFTFYGQRNLGGYLLPKAALRCQPDTTDFWEQIEQHAAP